MFCLGHQVVLRFKRFAKAWFEGPISFVCAVDTMAREKCELSVGGYSDCSRTQYINFEQEPIQRRSDLAMYCI